MRGKTMIRFETFRLEEGVPIYQQILLYIKRGVIAGSICDGDELPSRRVLSALLQVNPNTVQKAYRMLEEEGLIQSQTGAKSHMQLDAETIARIRAELLENDAKTVVAAMRQMGLTKAEALRIIEMYWE